jgi:hypothetical protein
MREPLRVGESDWVTWPDFSYPVIARDDSPELIEECWQFLAEEFSQHRHTTYPKPRRASGDLIAAKVRASAVGVGSDQDLRRKVERQQLAIERLLAFVPRREQQVPRDRLTDIAREIGREAAQVFSVANAVVTILDETDEEALAAHRIVVDIAASADFDAVDFVEKSVELQRWFASNVAKDELKSIRLLVEPVP